MTGHHDFENGYNRGYADGLAAKAAPRLVDAAPDLLSALEALMQYEDEDEGLFLTGDADKARAAIAKAKGESFNQRKGKTHAAD
jgi:hypothetical protein